MIKCSTLILGRTLWRRDPDGWRVEEIGSGLGLNSKTITRLRERVAANPSEQSVVVFEPEGISHELVEMPKVGRKVFASLARVRSEHPVVASENLGWGIEMPEPNANGKFATLIHSEMAPGLVHLRNAFVQRRCKMLAAWSPYTVIDTILKCRSRNLKVRRGVVLTSDFVAFATCNSARRLFRVWEGPMSERDWKAFSVLIAEPDPMGSSSPSGYESGNGGIIVISDGDPARCCPLWNDLQASGKVKTVLGIDEFADYAAKIPVNHPANLLEAFPFPRVLDRYLASIMVIGIAVCAILGGIALNESRRFQGVEKTAQRQIAELKVRLDGLKRNQREMLVLRSQVLNSSKLVPISKQTVLTALASAVPESTFLTSISIGRNGSFVVDALVYREGFNPERAREGFKNNGFSLNKDDGWIFDNRNATLHIDGQFAERMQ